MLPHPVITVKSEIKNLTAKQAGVASALATNRT